MLSVQGASSLEQLRQLLGALEHNLQKGWLSPTYIRDPVLVKKAFNPVGREVAAVALASQNECMRLRPADVHPGARIALSATRTSHVGIVQRMPE